LFLPRRGIAGSRGWLKVTLMRRIPAWLWNFIQRFSGQRRRPSLSRRQPTVRLQLRPLEERVTPAVVGLGSVSGVVAVLSSVNSAPFSLQGIQVTLSGTSNQGDAVNLTGTTDAQGDFAIRSVEAGSYLLSAAPGNALLQGAASTVTVTAGQNTVQNLGAGTLAPSLISLRDFLATTTNASLGLPSAGATANSPPTVHRAITNVALASGGAGSMIDLAANFSDPNTTNSQIVFDTSDGAMTVNLFDAQAPQTVANFLDYIQNSRYNDTIFQRLDTNPPVLQGGGFGLKPDAANGFTFPVVANSGDPNLANEFSSSLPDTLGTIAMAKLGGNPNSATSEFFFNLADNSRTLGSSNNGGFAVFGSVASDATSQAVFKALQATPVQNESGANSAFGTLLINSGSNLAAFPKNTKQSDYLVVNDVRIVKQDESLTYSVVSNSNPAIVNAQFTAGHPEVLSLQPVAGQSGTATITVQATDQFGASVQTSFQATIDPLTISSTTNPITTANAMTTSVMGMAAAGASISVTASDGFRTTTAVTTTAGTDGTWTASNVNVGNLSNGSITYTATTTDAAGNTVTVTKTATKGP
jgi:cyclophilin family peptidyl-prolyl cis-trans isomerase